MTAAADTNSDFMLELHTEIDIKIEDQPGRQYHCLICGAEFDSDEDVSKHKRIAHQRTPEITECGNHQDIACNVCSKAFCDVESLRSHLNYHAKDWEENRKMRYTNFCSFSNLRFHMRAYINEYCFKCDLCHFAYQQVGTLVEHYDLHLSGKLKNDK